MCDVTDPAHDHLALRAPVGHRPDTQPDEPVVDQHVVARLQHVADHGGRDRQLPALAIVLRAHGDGLALAEDEGLLELADPELRPLEVGDQGDRAPCRRLGFADATRALGMLLVRPVREVEPRRVHPRGDELAQLLRRVRRRP